MARSRRRRRKQNSQPLSREAGIAFGLSCASAIGVLLYDHFVDPFQLPALVAVAAFAGTLVSCALVPTLIADLRARRAARSSPPAVSAPPREEEPLISHEPAQEKKTAHQNESVGPPWPVIILIGAIASVFLWLSGPLFRRVISAGVPSLVTEAFFLLAFGAITGGILLLWQCAAGRTTTRKAVVTLVFMNVIVTTVALMQPYLYELLESAGWPSDFLQDSSWLIAVVLIAWPAERLGRRLGVTIGRPKDV